MAAPVTWSTYAERLVNTEKVFDKAGFLGLDGKLWGACNLNLSAEEVQQITKAISDPMSSRGVSHIMKSRKSLPHRSEREHASTQSISFFISSLHPFQIHS